MIIPNINTMTLVTTSQPLLNLERVASRGLETIGYSEQYQNALTLPACPYTIIDIKLFSVGGDKEARGGTTEAAVFASLGMAHHRGVQLCTCT